MSTEGSSGHGRKGRSGLLAVVTIVIIVAAFGTIFFAVGMSASSSTKYTVVENLTVYGRASGLPCAALRLPCVLPTNQSSILAGLVLFGGKYYYVSNITTNSVIYTVWYDNSTYYCVSPEFQGVNTCPP